MSLRALGLLAMALAAASACSSPPPSPPKAGAGAGAGDPKRGRAVYLSHCISCHAADPSKEGVLGPPVKGASRELLQARVIDGTYPPGHVPKRPTDVMRPLPQLAGSIDDLAAYLQ